MYQCPCCDFISLTSKGRYEICPVCNWEDDGYVPEKPEDLDGPPGPNSDTLRECRKAFLNLVATEGLSPEAAAYERKPRDIPL